MIITFMWKLKKKYLIPLLFFNCLIGYSQITVTTLSGEVKIPVMGLQGDSLAFPFAGGLNNCQFGSIDLDLDGTNDLLVFDRHGDRLLTFLNNDKPGTIGYTFNPSFARKLPSMNHWMESVDYNMDGKVDIFTYTTGGIKVFSNESDTALKFRQVSYPYLVSLQGTTLTNILVTYVDYPAIADIDGDGDMDIVTFWGLGSFLEWHKNMSVELYGTADSLVFRKFSSCWGHFAEGIESNNIKLDTCVDFDEFIGKNNGPKHTGSTLLANDFTGDGVYDMVIGDVDFPNLILMTNGGDTDTAIMISFTTDFPNSLHPVNLTSFPVSCMMDVNNDGKRDILVSPFDPSMVRSESTHSCWLYLNKQAKTNTLPVYEFYKDDFIQSEMLDFGSGAYPVFFDYNADGLDDLIIGNFGVLDSSWFDSETGLICNYTSSLSLLRNVGTTEKPAFRWISSDYLGLASLGMQSLIPALGDLDGDGDQDMLCGNSKGKLVFLENKAKLGEAAAFTLIDPAYMQIDVGDFSAPQIFDLNRDGLNDIISGKRNGRLSFYRNIGPSDSPEFILETDTLGGVDVTNTSLSYFGYSVPFFYTGLDGKCVLFVGSEFGEIFTFKDIEQYEGDSFTPAGKLVGVNKGWRTGVAINDLDSDTLLEFIIGNYSGGLELYRGLKSSIAGTDMLFHPQSSSFNIQPNPSKGSVIIGIDNVKMNQKLNLEIRSTDGRLLKFFHSISFPVQLDVADLSNGLYLIKAQSKTESFSGKLLIVK